MRAASSSERSIVLNVTDVMANTTGARLKPWTKPMPGIVTTLKGPDLVWNTEMNSSFTTPTFGWNMMSHPMATKKPGISIPTTKNA